MTRLSGLWMVPQVSDVSAIAHSCTSRAPLMHCSTRQSTAKHQRAPGPRGRCRRGPVRAAHSHGLAHRRGALVEHHRPEVHAGVDGTPLEMGRGGAGSGLSPFHWHACNWRSRCVHQTVPVAFRSRIVTLIVMIHDECSTRFVVTFTVTPAKLPAVAPRLFASSKHHCS